MLVLCLGTPAPVFALRDPATSEKNPATLAGLEEALRGPAVGLEEPTRGLFLRAAVFAGLLLGIDPSPSLVRAQPLDRGKLEAKIGGIASKTLLEDGSAYVDSQRITGRQPVVPTNIPKGVLDNYQKERGRPFRGFDLNGLYQSYTPDPRNPTWEKSKYVVANGRVWIYDSALGIITDLSRGKTADARRAVNALVELGKDEQALGFTGGWHFSYNTVDDSWLDPRSPMGNTLWGIKAIYLYVGGAVKSKDAAVRREAIDHLKWTNALVKQLVFNEMQVNDEKDKRYGLIRAMKYNSLLDIQNPRSKKPYTLDEVGYRAYEGNANKVAEDIIFEHNSDLVDVLRLAATVTEAAGVKDDDFQKELVRRHEILLNGIWAKGWAGDHFITALGPDGTQNKAVAVDNNTWVPHVFLPYEEDRAWQAIEYTWNEFRTKDTDGKIVGKVKDLVLEGASAAAQRRLGERSFAGLFFFQADFKDPYVDVPKAERQKLEQMVQAEATFGYIHYLVEFARVTKDAKRREEALKRSELLYQSMGTLRELYPGRGLPYATVFVTDLFNTLRGMAPTASGVIVTRRLQGASTGFIGVDPPASFTFQGRKPGERPEVKPEEEVKPAPAPKELGAAVKNFAEDSITLQLEIPEALKGKTLRAAAFIKTDTWYLQPAEDRTAMKEVKGGRAILTTVTPRSPFKKGSVAIAVFESPAKFDEFLKDYKKSGFRAVNKHAIRIFKIDSEGKVESAERISFNPAVDSLYLGRYLAGGVDVGPDSAAFLAAREPLPPEVLLAAQAGSSAVVGLEEPSDNDNGNPTPYFDIREVNVVGREEKLMVAGLLYLRLSGEAVELVGRMYLDGGPLTDPANEGLRSDILARLNLFDWEQVLTEVNQNAMEIVAGGYLAAPLVVADDVGKLENYEEAERRIRKALGFSAGLEELPGLGADPEMGLNLARFGALHGDRLLGIVRPDGQAVAGVAGELQRRLPPDDFILSRRNQPNLLSSRRWQFAREISAMQIVISEKLIPLGDRGAVYDSVAQGLGISRQEAQRLVRFVPADPAGAADTLRGVRRQYDLVFAALDEDSYGKAVQSMKDQLQGWTVLLLQTANLNRRIGVHELLNLLTDLKHWQRVTTYTINDVGLEEAIFTSA